MTLSRKHLLPALLILCLIPPALHADAPKAQKRAEFDYLRDAYKTLSMANNDYAGHRVKAMNAIEAACDLLGHDVRGEAGGRERQHVSDAQLREARAQLNQARVIVDAHRQKEVTADLDEALKQLDLALATR